MIVCISVYPKLIFTCKAQVMGITKIEQTFMAFIQYFSQAESGSLVKSFVPKLENYGMNFPKDFCYSKQLYGEFKIANNNLSKVNLLISWVNQTQRTCSVEIWSDEPFLQKKTMFRKVNHDIRQFIKPLNLSSSIK